MRACVRVRACVRMCLRHVCMCLLACVLACIYACVCACVHVLACVLACVCACMCACFLACVLACGMCACLLACLHVCLLAACVHVCVLACVHVCLLACVHVCLCVCMCLLACLLACLRVCICACMRLACLHAACLHVCLLACLLACVHMCLHAACVLACGLLACGLLACVLARVCLRVCACLCVCVCVCVHAACLLACVRVWVAKKQNKTKTKNSQPYIYTPRTWRPNEQPLPRWDYALPNPSQTTSCRRTPTRATWSRISPTLHTCEATAVEHISHGSLAFHHSATTSTSTVACRRRMLCGLATECLAQQARRVWARWLLVAFPTFPRRFGRERSTSTSLCRSQERWVWGRAARSAKLSRQSRLGPVENSSASGEPNTVVPPLSPTL